MFIKTNLLTNFNIKLTKLRYFVGYELQKSLLIRLFD